MNEQGKSGTYTLLTYGCQMNEHDSETIAGILKEMGYEEAPSLEESDLILLNTCSIRENAVEKIFGKVGDLKRLKYTNPELLIGICGCLPQHEGAVEKIRRRAPHVDLVFGTHNLYRLPALIAKARDEGQAVVEVWESEGEVVENLPIRRAEGLKAYVTIMYGCNNFCAYCVVPYTRGRERSRRPEDIVEEVKRLGAGGYKEITLLGQNVNSYGKDAAGQPDPAPGTSAGTDFAGLLELLDPVDGIERIRYMTSHPRDFHQRLIDTIARSRKVCEHFHLPVQAGSNEVLRWMNRGYTRESYLDLVQRVREKIPEASVTTDIIVGFPGETEEHFEETLDLLRRAEFDAAYTFMFSPRKGTPAAGLPGQHEQAVKKSRLQRLMALQNEISLRKNNTLVGRELEVLVEGRSKNDPNVLSGRTRTNKLVLLRADDRLVGKLVPVRIREARTWTLHGEASSV